MVSVIVVSYNHSDYVEECLNSLLNQTYKNWELIVADDASKDSSVDVIDSWLGRNKIEAQKVFLLAKGECISIKPRYVL